MKAPSCGRGKAPLALVVYAIAFSLFAFRVPAVQAAEPTESLRECNISGISQVYSNCPVIFWTDPNDANTAAHVGAQSNRGEVVNPIDVPFQVNPVSNACRYIDNISPVSNPKSLFIPFRSPQEWNSFITAAESSPVSSMVNLTRCARATIYNLKSDGYCCSNPDPEDGEDIVLPYAKAGSTTTITHSTAFGCDWGNIEIATATFKPSTTGSADQESPPSGEWAFDISGWDVTTTYVHGGCGAANKVPTTVAPSVADRCVNSTDVNFSGSGPWTWDCKADGTSNTATVSCEAPYTSSATCGAADGVITSSIPTTELCSGGSTASEISGSGPWSWTCTAGNSTVSCSAPTALYCGDAGWDVFSTKPTKDLCPVGATATTVTGSGPWTWYCKLGGISKWCKAYKDDVAQCGDAAYTGGTSTEPTDELCFVGNASSVSHSGGYWLWGCSVGTSTMSCKVADTSSTGATCGSANGTMSTSKPSGAALCSSGTATTVSQANGLWTWGCKSGETSVSCYATKCNCAICGTAAGVATSTAPSSNLCAGGDPTSVSVASNGDWTWVCILDTTIDGVAHHDEHRCYAPKN